MSRLEKIFVKKIELCNTPKEFVILMTISFGLCLISNANAQGFDAESVVNYQSVTIGYPGNTNDSSGFGNVSYTYNIGKYDVTIGQYTIFLNHVAESDPHQLWNPGMAQPYVQGIKRTGVSGSYVYSVMTQYTESNLSSESMPITGVSWFSAARFANWMANGQLRGTESAGTTETGAYNLDGIVNGKTVARNDINPNTGESPSYYIPTENEWYKAAYYYIPTGVTGSYYTYATQSNTLPGNIIGSSSNLANFLYDSESGYCVTQSQLFEPTTYLTNVGTFSGSPSFFQTFDQTGNVWEWNDLTGQASLQKGLRGAAWTSPPAYMSSSYRLIVSPAGGAVNVGFRLSGPGQ